MFEIAVAPTGSGSVRRLVRRAATRISNTVVAVTTSSTISIKSSSGQTFLRAPIQALLQAVLTLSSTVEDTGRIALNTMCIHLRVATMERA